MQAFFCAHLTVAACRVHNGICCRRVVSFRGDVSRIYAASVAVDNTYTTPFVQRQQLHRLVAHEAALARQLTLFDPHRRAINTVMTVTHHIVWHRFGFEKVAHALFEECLLDCEHLI